MNRKEQKKHRAKMYKKFLSEGWSLYYIRWFFSLIGSAIFRVFVSGCVLPVFVVSILLISDLLIYGQGDAKIRHFIMGFYLDFASNKEYLLTTWINITALTFISSWVFIQWISPVKNHANEKIKQYYYQEKLSKKKKAVKNDFDTEEEYSALHDDTEIDNQEENYEDIVGDLNLDDEELDYSGRVEPKISGGADDE